MRINMAVQAAENLINGLYEGLSNPFSKIKNDDRSDSLEWLQSHPKRGSLTPRLRTALRFYLHLGQETIPSPLPIGYFPAIFNFIDCTRRPDKATIKIALALGIIENDNQNGELVFRLTEEGQRVLPEN